MWSGRGTAPGVVATGRPTESDTDVPGPELQAAVTSTTSAGATSPRPQPPNGRPASGLHGGRGARTRASFHRRTRGGGHRRSFRLDYAGGRPSIASSTSPTSIEAQADSSHRRAMSWWSEPAGPTQPDTGTSGVTGVGGSVDD